MFKNCTLAFFLLNKIAMRIYLILFIVVFSSAAMAQDIKTKNKDLTRINAINNVMDQWHKAAANADFEAFFACMDDDGYYIGTDESEKWTIKEFKAFCKPYFDRGSAWDFKPFDRGVYFNKKNNIAWIDEKLDTWMGVCRSSGVLTKTKDGWKIKHYQLSVTVPNDIVRDFIQLVNQYKTKQTK